MGKVVGLAASVCCAIIITIVIVIAMGFKRVETNNVAIAYNKVTRSLSEEVYEEGLHFAGPSAEMITFSLTQQEARVVDVPALSRDSIRIQLDILVLYTVEKDNIRLILDRFYDVEGHSEFMQSYVVGIARDTAATFSAKQFFLQRTAFQQSLDATLRARFLADDVAQVTVDSVQVLTIDLPTTVLNQMEASSVAEQDIQNAQTERATQVQAAELTLDRARSEAELVLIDAARDVTVIEQSTQQAIQVEREKMEARGDAFGNISQGLGFGGDFFVQSYLKYLVLQENRGTNVVGL